MRSDDAAELARENESLRARVAELERIVATSSPFPEDHTATNGKDVADPKESERAVREERDWFAEIVSIAPVVICSFRKRPDGSWCFPFANPRLEQIYGLRAQDLAEDAMPIFTRMHPDDVGRVRVTIDESARTMTPWRCEYRVRKPERREIWVEGHAVPTPEPNGGILWRGYLADVTARNQTQAALRDRERFLGIVTGSARVGLVVVGAGYQYLFANEAYAEIFSLDTHDIVGRYVPDVLAAAWSQIKPRLDRALAGERVLYELCLPPLPGAQTRRFYSVAYEPRTSEGEEFTVVVVVVDITERKRAEEELRESEQRLRLFIEHAPVAIAMFDQQMRYLTVSRRWMSDYSLLEGEFVGRSHYEVFPEVPESWRSVHRRALAGEVVKDDEDRFVRADGAEQWLRWEVRPWHRAEGTIGGIVIFSEDITERKQADRAQQETEARYRRLFEQAPDGIMVANHNKQYLDANPSMCRMLGYTHDELIGMSGSDIVAEEEIQHIGKALDALKDKSDHSREWRLRRKDGSIFAAEVIATIMPDGNILGLVRDITERKRAEAALHESEARYRTLFEYAPDGILIADPDSHYLDANPSICRMLGYTREELIRLGASDIVSQSEIRQIGPALRAIKNKSEYYREWQFRRNDGSVFAVEVIATMMPDGNLLALVRDITERKRAEAALHESEARYRTLFDYAPDGILIADSGTFYIDANPSMCRMLGYARDELIGLHASDIVAQSELHLIEPAVRVINAKSDYHQEWRFRRKDGSVFGVEVIATMMPDGNLLALVRDITERQRAAEALQRLNAELIQGMVRISEVNQELKAKTLENESFVYSVSHDLRSPLVNLQGFSKELGRSARDLRRLLLEQDLSQSVRDGGLRLLDGPIAKSLHFIETAVTRVSSIIDALLRLSRAGRVEYQRTRVDMHPVVTRIVESLQVTKLERRATIQIKDLPPALGDSPALEQVFANLIGNALNYLDGKRPGHIEVGSLGSDQPSLAAGLCTYYVRDNGLGISEAGKTKVFQPFQRFHPQVASGEGLGLAIVKRVVERHGGKIWFESAVGQGTTFFVALPSLPHGEAAHVE